MRVSLTACEPCRVTFDPTPGGASCPHCGARGVTALVVLARDGATVEAIFTGADGVEPLLRPQSPGQQTVNFYPRKPGQTTSCGHS